MVRADLCNEAIRLGQLVRQLMAPQPPSEVTALVALMLLHDSRRDARPDEAGDLVLLEDIANWTLVEPTRINAACYAGLENNKASVMIKGKCFG